MAAIRKRKGKWQAQVRRVGARSISKSFQTKSEAIQWARKVENNFDLQSHPADYSTLKQLRLADLLSRYEREITPRKRGSNVELYRLRVLKRHPMSELRLSDVSAHAIARYRDDRLADVAADTVRRELTVLRHCFEVARRDWGFPITPNPVAVIHVPAPGKPRDRRLTAEETALLLEHAQKGPWYLSPLIELALETGLRRGELLAMRWDHIDGSRSLLSVPLTKNGRPRTIPLTPKACEVLQILQRRDEIYVFPVSANAVRLAWERLRSRLGIEDIRFHDLRHEAISRLFEMGLSVPEVALISGHRDPGMLFRYTHLRAEDVGRKLVPASLVS